MSEIKKFVLGILMYMMETKEIEIFFRNARAHVDLCVLPANLTQTKVVQGDPYEMKAHCCK